MKTFLQFYFKREFWDAKPKLLPYNFYYTLRDHVKQDEIGYTLGKRNDFLMNMHKITYLDFNREENESVSWSFFDDEKNYIGEIDIHINFSESTYYIPSFLKGKIYYVRTFFEDDTAILKKYKAEHGGYFYQDIMAELTKLMPLYMVMGNEETCQVGRGELELYEINTYLNMFEQYNNVSWVLDKSEIISQLKKEKEKIFKEQHILLKIHNFIPVDLPQKGNKNLVNWYNINCRKNGIELKDISVDYVLIKREKDCSEEDIANALITYYRSLGLIT